MCVPFACRGPCCGPEQQSVVHGDDSTCPYVSRHANKQGVRACAYLCACLQDDGAVARVCLPPQWCYDGTVQRESVGACWKARDSKGCISTSRVAHRHTKNVSCIPESEF